ncbi:MAG: hypothetical protein J5531_04670 [Lachnospiraceae bacterium]|nr:hypothetical protein [Lachnospiraceae bacterium]
MGGYEVFNKVKQYGDLYSDCMAAKGHYEGGSAEEGYPYVCKAFAKMKRILAETIGGNAQDLLDGTILTDLSKRNYEMYKWETIEKQGFDIFKQSEEATEFDEMKKRMDPYYALQEEVGKFADYYLRGVNPNSIAEICATSTDRGHTTRGGRNMLDTVASFILVGLVSLLGIVLLLLSTSSKYSYLFPSGLVVMFFAVALVWMRLRVHKD